MTDSALRLRYSANGEPKGYSVPVDWTRCHYGGRRPWLLCGGCGRRVAVLYLADTVFSCRHCARLAYASQNETDFARHIRRRDKLRARLNAPPGIEPILSKPPRMHWRTFERLCEAVDRAELDACGSLSEQRWLNRALP